ncbi:MAG: DUF1992 domain-containing protein [Actinomycetales bacterium]
MSWPNVEREISDAQARGEFDNLPGAGKPLDLSDADDPNWWIRRFAERERLSLAEALPPMLALRKQADGFPDSLAGLPDETAVREVLEAYNAAVRREIARPATGAGHPVIAHVVDVDELTARWSAEYRPQPEPEPAQVTEVEIRQDIAAPDEADGRRGAPPPEPTPAPTDRSAPASDAAQPESWWRRLTRHF